MADILVISGNSSLGASYVGGVAPTSADRILLDATSGQFTIDATLACRSIDCTGYTNIITHNAGIAVNIGDATSAVGNLALKFVNGMIYNRLNPATSAINFISTNATQQQVEWGGNTFGNVTFKGVGSSYIFNDDLTCQKYFATLDIQNGTVNTNGKTITTMVFTETTTATKVITLGGSVINCYPAISESFSWANATGLTITANTATVNVYRSPTNTNGVTFIRVPSGLSNYLTMNIYGGGIRTMASGSSTAFYKDVNFYSAPALFNIDDRVQMNQSVAVTGMVRIYGYSATRRTRVHNGGDFILPNATALYCEYTDFQSMHIPTYTVNLSASLGGTGNLGDNGGITFTASKTCYWFQAIAGTKIWSDGANWFNATGGTGGSSGKPLAQDTARFDANSFPNTGSIVQCDLNSLQLGKDIDWTGALNNPTWDFSADVNCYGSLTLIAGMSLTAYSDAFFTMLGSGTNNTYTLTTAGQIFPHTGFLINLSTTNSCVLQDDFNGNVLNTTLLQVNGLLINFNNKNITVGKLTIAGTAVTLGNGLLKLKGSGTVLNSSVTTVNATTCTIEVNSQDVVNKTIAGNGKTYGSLKLSGNFSDQITFTGNNTWVNFDNIKTVAHTLLFTAGSTNTFTGSVTKTTGALWTLASTTTSIFTWSKASGTVTFVDAIISKSTASGGATFTANTNSVNGGGNTGWAGFISSPFMWTGSTNTDASLGSNWAGGNQPTASDLAIFSGAFNINCVLNTNANPLNTWKGILITSAYTGVITQSNNLVYGSDGIEINGGTFTGGAFNITNAGKLKVTGGTYTNNNTTHFITSQGSVLPTVSITGGTYNHNSGIMQVTGSLDAIVSNTSARQFYNFYTSSFTGKLSGTFFVDNITSLQSQEFNGDLSCKTTLQAFTLTGTGTIRLIGVAITVNMVECYNLQFNCTGTATLNQDVIVNNTLTVTAVPTCNGFTVRAKGNLTSVVTAITGTTNTSIEGTKFEQQISGAGVYFGNISVNKSAGLVKATANISPCNLTNTFTVTTGQFNTNEYQVVFNNNLIVNEASGGLFFKTPLSVVQVNGALTGRKILRQKLYANGVGL